MSLFVLPVAISELQLRLPGICQSQKEHPSAHVQLISRRAVLAAAAAVTTLTFTHTTLAFSSNGVNLRGQKIFENNCAACHAGGGNVIAFSGGKNLKTRALRKAGLLERDALVEYIKVGKGVMPGYKDKLDIEELWDVSDFTLEMAARDWK